MRVDFVNLAGAIALTVASPAAAQSTGTIIKASHRPANPTPCSVQVRILGSIAARSRTIRLYRIANIPTGTAQIACSPRLWPAVAHGRGIH